METHEHACKNTLYTINQINIYPKKKVPVDRRFCEPFGSGCPVYSLSQILWKYNIFYNMYTYDFQIWYTHKPFGSGCPVYSPSQILWKYNIFYIMYIYDFHIFCNAWGSSCPVYSHIQILCKYHIFYIMYVYDFHIIYTHNLSWMMYP